MIRRLKTNEDNNDEIDLCDPTAKLRLVNIFPILALRCGRANLYVYFLLMSFPAADRNRPERTPVTVRLRAVVHEKSHW